MVTLPLERHCVAKSSFHWQFCCKVGGMWVFPSADLSAQTRLDLREVACLWVYQPWVDVQKQGLIDGFAYTEAAVHLAFKRSSQNSHFTSFGTTQGCISTEVQKGLCIWRHKSCSLKTWVKMWIDSMGRILNGRYNKKVKHTFLILTCTGSSSTFTWPAISIMSRARWQMDWAWWVQGSGSPLTVMYLSPTVSTCQGTRGTRLEAILSVEECRLLEVEESPWFPQITLWIGMLTTHLNVNL